MRWEKNKTINYVDIAGNNINDENAFITALDKLLKRNIKLKWK